MVFNELTNLLGFLLCNLLGKPLLSLLPLLLPQRHTSQVLHRVSLEGPVKAWIWLGWTRCRLLFDAAFFLDDGLPLFIDDRLLILLRSDEPLESQLHALPSPRLVHTLHHAPCQLPGTELLHSLHLDR